MDDKITVYTTSWCGDCRRAKAFLQARGLLYNEIDIEENEGAEEFVMSVNNGKRKVPTFKVGGRAFHCSPFDSEVLIRELGLSKS